MNLDSKLFHRCFSKGFTPEILFPFLLTRLGLGLIAWCGFHFLFRSAPSPEAWQIGADGNRQALSAVIDPSIHPWLNMWARWDAGWYLDIAKQGYFHRANEPANTAFFPLYPSFIAAAHQLLRLPPQDYWYLLSGVVLSNASLLAGLAYLRRLLHLDYSHAITARSLLYCLIFPTSFFFSCAYTESLFFCLTVSAFYYGRTGRWLLASLLAALAALTRSQGVILLVPLTVEYFTQRKLLLSQIRADFFALALIPSALLMYLWILSLHFGSWDVLISAQAPWGRHFMLPWNTFRWLFRPGWLSSLGYHEAIDLSFFLFLAGCGLVTWITIPFSYRTYLWLSAAFFASWGMLGSVPRFVLVVFPMFLVLSLVVEGRRWLHLILVFSFVLLGAWFFLQFSQWQWVA